MLNVSRFCWRCPDINKTKKDLGIIQWLEKWIRKTVDWYNNYLDKQKHESFYDISNWCQIMKNIFAVPIFEKMKWKERLSETIDMSMKYIDRFEKLVAEYTDSKFVLLLWMVLGPSA